ncbi:MAG: alpha/beta fold hydrolase, partial [Caulobacteraceae bacterium]
MAFAQLSKVRLEYFLQGDGPERVALIHGFQASARIWSLVQAALPPDRFQSIAINNRGAGASDAPADEADYGVPIFAADAFELLSGLGWKNFTLVGHSLGGATAA